MTTKIHEMLESFSLKLEMTLYAASEAPTCLCVKYASFNAFSFSFVVLPAFAVKASRRKGVV